MPKVSLEYMQNIDKIYSPQWKRTHLLGDQGGSLLTIYPLNSLNLEHENALSMQKI